MMLRSFFTLCFSVAALTLGACAQVAPPPLNTEITFTHLPAHQVAVGNIEVESRYSMPMVVPNVEHKIPQSPEKIMRRWASDRLHPSGGNLIGRVVILDASLTEHALATDGTLKAVFTNEQALRYQAVAEAVLEIRDAAGTFLGNASARVTRTLTVPEKASLSEREQALFDLVDQMMQDFNVEMDKNIGLYLSQWVH